MYVGTRQTAGKGSRRAIRLLHIRTQLIMTSCVLLISLGFAALFAWHAQHAYGALYAMVASTAPESFLAQIREQGFDFVVVSAVIALLYVAVSVGFCVTFSHRLLGPIVALRRQVEALKNGDYGSRVQLRNRDIVFQPIAEDMNELAMMLSDREKKSESVR